MSSVALVALAALAAPSSVVAQPTAVEVRTDIAYTNQGGEDILLDAYVPEAPGPHPAVVWIHGGRWATGDKSQDAGLIEALAAEGFVVFSINYRIVKEAPYPAAVEDVQTAVRWIRDNAAEYDVDPDRIGAIGVSSGGHLAALLATLGEGPHDRGSRISAAVALSGPMDLVTASEDTGNLGRAVTVFLDCTPPACAEIAAEASPITHVDETDAPIMMFNSVEEVIPVEQATSMGAALDAAGVPNEVVIVPGTEHASSMVGGGKPGMPDVAAQYTEFFLTHVAGEAEATPSPTAAPSPERDDGSPVSAPAPPVTGGGNSLAALLFGAVALAALAGIVGSWVRRRRLEREPY